MTGRRVGGVSWAAGWTGLAAIALAACGGVDSGAQTLAEKGSDVSDVTARVSGLVASLALGGAPTSLASIGASIAVYTPSGCVVAQPDGDGLTLTFHGCSGPWGLVDVTGSITVGLTSSGSELVVGSKQGVRFGRAAVSAFEPSSASVAGASMSWTPSLSGSTARGEPFSSSGAWTLSWKPGQTCVQVAEDSQADVGGGPLSLMTSGITRCNADCPTGGTLLVQAAGLTTNVAFDGQDVAVFTTESGASDIVLACGL